MATKLHNIPAANTPGKQTNVIIEHGMARLVFSRIGSSNIIQVSITPNIERERMLYQFMLTIDELDTVSENLDLEEVEFE